MLEEHCNLDHFVGWMRLVADELVEQGAPPTSDKLPESIYRAQMFLFCWAQYTSLIICDLTCRDAPSLGTTFLDSGASSGLRRTNCPNVMVIICRVFSLSLHVP